MVLVKITVTYYVIAMSSRTVGRLFNPEYRIFADTLMRADRKGGDATAAIARLREYDYQVFAAPMDFRAIKEPKKSFKSPSRFTADGNLLYTTFRDFLAYNIACSFARGLIYPGSISFLNSLMLSFLVESRRKLIVEKGGKRAVLITTEGDRVDAMFVDQRGSGANSDILVVTCEGNAGFYETGIMMIPLALNYSVLGWNQPGFGESSGIPMPKQTIASIDTVMQYAVHKLGFSEDQIVIYAWSIGGFPATWAAANYPNIKALILDATFDDLLPLAEAKMPRSWSPLVEFLVRKYFDLPIALQLESYRGPVTLIRRTQDEMIVTVEIGTDDERLATNRANHLLKSLLRSRHPKLFENSDSESFVDIWLAATPLNRTAMTRDCPPAFSTGNFENLTDKERATVIYCLCSKYMKDFPSTHNTPLDPSLFTIPTPLR